MREFSSPAPPKAVAVPAGSELAKELETYEAGVRALCLNTFNPFSGRTHTDTRTHTPLSTTTLQSPADASASSQQTSTSASAEEHQGETAEDFLEGLKADQKVEAHH